MASAFIVAIVTLAALIFSRNLSRAHQLDGLVDKHTVQCRVIRCPGRHAARFHKLVGGQARPRKNCVNLLAREHYQRRDAVVAGNGIGPDVPRRNSGLASTAGFLSHSSAAASAAACATTVDGPACDRLAVDVLCVLGRQLTVQRVLLAVQEAQRTAHHRRAKLLDLVRMVPRFLKVAAERKKRLELIFVIMHTYLHSRIYYYYLTTIIMKTYPTNNYNS
ncbi:uncharacterized protein SPSK_02737 [Sporothrix schenckii 1099-18]|uniref:Secreted protein n=1 Tax=Sporothrix schenckii 1099-18 TaxID=1397361 RepID=A0A0F2MFA3_SPOSC|nr:uncharacterized protein SPSK_02737 [Sporothrix schenckii 1099-18]KJR86846.1 hypothetical protein SPSK_02737 [Sporothrix schenckii 1099-18]